MTTQTFTASNGAFLYSPRPSSTPGPTRLIVAGQHGNETGPIEALAGWSPREGGGTCAIIACANPLGYALNTRYCSTEADQPREMIDMNRGWGTGLIAQNTELWYAAIKMLGGVPDIVIDLHSSAHPHTAGHRLDMGRQVLAADERALPLAVCMSRAMLPWERDWIATLGEHREGCLHDYAASQGAVAVTVEFDEQGKERKDRGLGVHSALDAAMLFRPWRLENKT